MVAKLKELDGAIVKKLLSESVGSLLVLLPDSFNGGMDDESKDQLRDIEVAVFGACTECWYECQCLQDSFEIEQGLEWYPYKSDSVFH